MKIQEKFSIKTKLLIIILTAVSLSTALALSVSILYDVRNSRIDLLSSSKFTAKLISENCKSPLIFNDDNGAKELFLSFETIPMVIYATLHDKNNKIFASYMRKGASGYIDIKKSVNLRNKFTKEGLYVSEPILHEGEKFGTLYLLISTDSLKNKIKITTLIFLIFFLVIMVISYYIALKLQQIISLPILELKNVTEKITHESDYSIRIYQNRADEIGLLQKSIDMMVVQLHKVIESLKAEIVERKYSQEEALRLRKYLRSIIDSMPSVLIAVDPEGRVKQWNFEAQRFTGIASPQAYLRPVTEVFTMLKEKEKLIYNSIEECKPQKFTEIIIKEGEKNQTYLNVTIYPLTEHGNMGAVIRIDDATEKTKMEMAMIQTEKMMSVGGLAAGMAHEINNPLGIILQGAQNIQRHTLTSLPKNKEIAQECGTDMEILNKYFEKRKINHYLEGIIAAAKRASDIVANMLQFSRKTNQSKSLADLSSIVNQTIELVYTDYDLKKKYDFRQIEIIRDYEQDLPPILCNPTEIQQVILNIVKNAGYALYEKKNAENAPHIIIRIKRDREYVLISIEDNGPGIPEELKSRIFEPFFTTKEVGAGTGLGLSVSYFIITKNHGGSVDFISKEGVGTTFNIWLPVPT